MPVFAVVAPACLATVALTARTLLQLCMHQGVLSTSGGFGVAQAAAADWLLRRKAPTQRRSCTEHGRQALAQCLLLCSLLTVMLPYAAYDSIAAVSALTPIPVTVTRVDSAGVLKTGDVICDLASFQAGTCSDYLNFDKVRKFISAHAVLFFVFLKLLD